MGATVSLLLLRKQNSQIMPPLSTFKFLKDAASIYKWIKIQWLSPKDSRNTIFYIVLGFSFYFNLPVTFLFQCLLTNKNM